MPPRETTGEIQARQRPDRVGQIMRNLFSFLKRERDKTLCRVKINFLPDDKVVPRVEWRHGQGQTQDWLKLLLFFYARIIFELAELNENRVARELMDFVEQISRRLQAGGPPLQIPLGKLQFTQELGQPSHRLYQARLLAKKKGDPHLELEGAFGKEKFYLPASFLALLQLALLNLDDAGRLRLAQCLGRLHDYYRFKRDFWDSQALQAGPLFAIGQGKLGEPEPEIDLP